MTIGQALEALDSAKFNTVSREEKIRWLSELDAQAVEYLQTLTGQEQPFSGYDADTDPETKLLIPTPYDQMYLYRLESRIDYQNSEYDRFNNANAMFEAAWTQFTQHCIRNCKPKSSGAFF